MLPDMYYKVAHHLMDLNQMSLCHQSRKFWLSNWAAGQLQYQSTRQKIISRWCPLKIGWSPCRQHVYSISEYSRSWPDHVPVPFRWWISLSGFWHPLWACMSCCAWPGCGRPMPCCTRPTPHWKPRSTTGGRGIQTSSFGQCTHGGLSAYQPYFVDIISRMRTHRGLSLPFLLLRVQPQQMVVMCAIS